MFRKRSFLVSFCLMFLAFSTFGQDPKENNMPRPEEPRPIEIPRNDPPSRNDPPPTRPESGPTENSSNDSSRGNNSSGNDESRRDRESRSDSASNSSERNTRKKDPYDEKVPSNNPSDSNEMGRQEDRDRNDDVNRGKDRDRNRDRDRDNHPNNNPVYPRNDEDKQGWDKKRRDEEEARRRERAAQKQRDDEYWRQRREEQDRRRNNNDIYFPTVIISTLPAHPNPTYTSLRRYFNKNDVVYMTVDSYSEQNSEKYMPYFESPLNSSYESLYPTYIREFFVNEFPFVGSGWAMYYEPDLDDFYIDFTKLRNTNYGKLVLIPMGDLAKKVAGKLNKKGQESRPTIVEPIPQLKTDRIYSFNLSGLPKGEYELRLLGRDGSTVRKIITIK